MKYVPKTQAVMKWVTTEPKGLWC